MNPFFILVIAVLMLMVVVSLVRGIAAFLRSTRADLEAGGDGAGPSAMQLKQNRMMMQRILFQAAAIIVIALVAFASR